MQDFPTSRPRWRFGKRNMVHRIGVACQQCRSHCWYPGSFDASLFYQLDVGIGGLDPVDERSVTGVGSLVNRGQVDDATLPVPDRLPVHLPPEYRTDGSRGSSNYIVDSLIACGHVGWNTNDRLPSASIWHAMSTSCAWEMMKSTPRAAFSMLIFCSAGSFLAVGQTNDLDVRYVAASCSPAEPPR